MLLEPTEPGPREQWAIRYDRYFDAQVPFVTHLSPDSERWLVESIAARENTVEGIECTVVVRPVLYGGWTTPGQQEAS